MRTRPFLIRVAEAALLLFMASGVIQAIAFLSRSSIWNMSWAMPAGFAVMAAAVLVGIHQGRAVARPLAMVAFGAMAIRGSVALADRGFPYLAFSLTELVAMAIVIGALGLAAWFGLSSAASRDLSLA